jgi:hypothetical protein
MPRPLLKHGLYRYNKHKCRCDLCKKAAHVAMNKYRQGRWIVSKDPKCFTCNTRMRLKIWHSIRFWKCGQCGIEVKIYNQKKIRNEEVIIMAIDYKREKSQ